MDACTICRLPLESCWRKRDKDQWHDEKHRRAEDVQFRAAVSGPSPVDFFQAVAESLEAQLVDDCAVVTIAKHRELFHVFQRGPARKHFPN